MIVKSQNYGADKYDQQIGGVVGNQACQHGDHGSFREDIVSNEAAPASAADATAWQNLIGELLCESERNEHAERPWISGATESLAPNQGGADIGCRLNEQRQQHPNRSWGPQKLDGSLERAEAPDRENEGKKGEKTDHPRQERPRARHFGKETGRDLDKPHLDKRRDHDRQRQSA
jgi:hypothetical protein